MNRISQNYAEYCIKAITKTLSLNQTDLDLDFQILALNFELRNQR